jgi:hypothetical protein
MVWNLTEDEIVQYWDLIKFGSGKVNNQVSPDKFFSGLLKELLSGKAQVWFLADAERNIKSMAITKIIKDISGNHVFLVDTLFGYSPMTPMEQKDGFDVLSKFALNMKINTVIAHIVNPQVGDLAKRAGMVKTHEIYKLELERAN